MMLVMLELWPTRLLMANQWQRQSTGTHRMDRDIYRIFLASVCHGVPVLANPILDQCTKMDHMLGDRGPRSMYSKPRLVVNTRLRILSYSLQCKVDQTTLVGRVSQSAQWAVSPYPRLYYMMHNLGLHSHSIKHIPGKTLLKI